MEAQSALLLERQMKVKEEFSALFATLDKPLDRHATHAGYSQLLTRIASQSFRRECLRRLD